MKQMARRLPFRHFTVGGAVSSDTATGLLSGLRAVRSCGDGRLQRLLRRPGIQVIDAPAREVRPERGTGDVRLPDSGKPLHSQSACPDWSRQAGSICWVWAIEAGVAGAPAAVWRIPLGLGSPSRVTFAEGCGTGLSAIGTTRNGDTIYWREWDRNSGTELGIVQYTVATGQRQLLPALGDSLQTFTSPRLIVSADGSRLCAGTKSYVDLRTGQLRSLSFQCFGFDRDGRFATFFELPNGRIALGVLDSDLDTTPAVISTAPMQTFKSWPIFDSNSLG